MTPPHALEAVTHAAQLFQQKHGTGDAARRVFVSGYTDEDRSDLVWDLLADTAAPAEEPDPSAVSGDLSVVFREGFRPAGLAGDLARRLEADRAAHADPAPDGARSTLLDNTASLQSDYGSSAHATDPQETR